jgi:hypothetical protein
MSIQFQQLPKKKKVLIVLVELGLFYSVAFAAGYSMRYMYTWFSSSFMNNFSIFLSLTLLALSCALLFCGLILFQRTRHYESTIEFPKEVPQEDYDKWRRLGGQIKNKKDSMIYNLILVLPSFYVGYVLLFLSFWFVGSLARYHYLNFLSTLPAFQQAFLTLGLLIIISLVLTFLPMLITINLTNEFMTRYLGYPTDEDIIFAETLVINYRLSVKDRKGANKEISPFLKSLTKFSRNWLNDKRKAYSQEFSKITGSKSALSRMLLFTPDSLIDQVRELFLKLGLSLRNWDDPECLKTANALIEKSNEYKPTSRIQRIANSIETYPKTITILTIAVAIILFILGYPQIAALIKG